MLVLTDEAAFHGGLGVLLSLSYMSDGLCPCVSCSVALVPSKKEKGMCFHRVRNYTNPIALVIAVLHVLNASNQR